MKLGLVGYGAIARAQHEPAIAASEGIELVALADPAARHDRLPVYPSLAAMLAAHPEITAVSLSQPPIARYAAACEAIAAGRHVMLEKPPATTLAEAQALVRLANEAGVTLFAAWHSRAAAAVRSARDWLAGTSIRSVRIEWKEDVRHWHPGQRWIWNEGGFGVFDPGINALSILTRILPQHLFITSADLAFPANRDAPIAASLVLNDAQGLKIAAEFDFRQTGPQSWDIDIETDSGPVTLSMGGATLRAGGKPLVDALDAEYAGVYRRFRELTATGESDVDLAPLQLVADAFLLGRRRTVEPFEDAT